MNNETYTNELVEHIDGSALLEKGTNIAKNLIYLVNTLNTIDDCINSLNDEKIWQGTSANYIKERFKKDKESLRLVYEELKNYSKYLLKVSSQTEETEKEITKILDEMDDVKLWQI